ncbi:MAG: rane protein in aromatic hydrocarbon degradation [Myxococcaceae bacterium]|nr:rane protein in aromatic hydrocarbon degradation [Myxococcaceae bacterium]
MYKQSESSTRGMARLVLTLSFLTVWCVASPKAHAGGLYFFDRGARALGRGGAFIAGADDPSALWYNPAGLFYSKNQMVADAVLPTLLADFTREMPNGEYAPKLTAKPTPIPIPTLAFSNSLGSRRVVYGAGIIAPNVLLMNWEQSVGPSREPSPARYSLLELKGTVLSNLSAGLAWELFDGLILGADLQVPIGYFRAKTALSACDAVLCSFSEQKDFDAYATVKTVPTYGVSVVLGAILDLDIVRFGFSMMTPYTLRGVGNVRIKMPTNPLFENAYQSGSKVHLGIKFPTILRWGSELRLVKWLRLEGAVVWEQWSRQKTIDIDTGSGVALNNVTGLGNYQVGNIHLQRNMRNIWSIRGGFEATFPRRWVGNIDFGMRGGLAWEKGAFANKDLTPLTIDTNKTIISGGFTFGLLKWLRFDTVGGLVFMPNLNVTNSEIRQPQAIRPPLKVFPSVIGNGHYAQAAFFLGGGFRVMTDFKSGWR